MRRGRQECLSHSAAGDFAKLSAGHIIDKSAHGDFLGNPRVGAKLLQLMTDIFVDVLKSVEKRGRDGCSSSAILDSVAQILFGGVHQAAIGVVDDHELPGVQQVMRYDEGAQSVFGDDAAGISNDVGVARFQTERANRQASIHTGEDGEMTLGARRETAAIRGCGSRVRWLGELRRLRSWLIHSSKPGEVDSNSAHTTLAVTRTYFFKRGEAGAWVVLCRNIRRRGRWLRGLAGCGQSIQFA